MDEDIVRSNGKPLEVIRNGYPFSSEKVTERPQYLGVISVRIDLSHMDGFTRPN
jgi:hypothetical protein